jgi:hypothetical protein
MYGDVTIANGGLQNLGLCSALSAFEQGGRYLYHAMPVVTRDLGFSRFIRRISPIQLFLMTHMEMWTIYSNPDPHGSPFNRLLRHTRGC